MALRAVTASWLAPVDVSGRIDNTKNYFNITAINVTLTVGTRSRLATWGQGIVDFLNHDWVPQYDHLIIDWMKTPLGVLILATISACLCGWVIVPQGWWVAAALAGVIGIGLVWPWLTLRGLQCALTFSSSRGCEGQMVAVRMHIRNRWPWAAWGVGLKLDLPHFPGVDAAVNRVGGWQTRMVDFDFVPPVRGRYPRTSASLTCGFPFGLYCFHCPVAVAAPLLVWPRTFPVGPLPEAAGACHDDGQMFRNKPGTAGDFLGVRPFRAGDSLRRVHWPQTARHDRLIVVERQTPALPWVQLILAGQGSDFTDGPQGSREWAIRVTASLAKGWLQQGARVELLAGRRHVPVDAGQRQVGRLLDALAQWQVTDELTVEESLRQPAVKQFAGSLHVVIATDAALVRAGHLGHGHRLFVVVLKQTAFRGPSSGPPLESPPVACHRAQWLVLEDLSQILTVFRQTWRGGSHGCN